MSKRIVIALGGNALGSNLEEQMKAVKNTAVAIADLIEEGNEIVIAHGNGPQVGMIQNAMTELRRSNPEKYVQSPLSVCVAMSQGYIGYDLQNALREELLDRGIQKDCATMLTQVEVSPDDPAFKNPTKPIGSFMTKEEADELVREKGYKVIEDSGRGYRRVVASPKPVSIVEIDTIKALVESNHVVIACGGGGIPVFKTGGHHLKGAAAVIDKDFAAEKLAEQLNADCLIILTAVEKVAIHFGTPEQEALSELTPELAEKYIEEGEFPAGSMLPKVQAAVAFTQSGEGRTSLITLLEKAKDGIAGKTGTSEKTPRGSRKYIASFLGFAPANNPEIIGLVMLDEPPADGLYMGGQIAAPTFQKIFDATLRYLNIDPQYTAEELTQAETTVPNVEGLSVKDAEIKFDGAGLYYKIVGNGESVISQTPKGGVIVQTESTVMLYTEENSANEAVVPSVIGKSIAEANRILTNAKLNVKVTGLTENGGETYVGSQSPEAGEKVSTGTVVTVEVLSKDVH